MRVYLVQLQVIQKLNKSITELVSGPVHGVFHLWRCVGSGGGGVWRD